GGVITGAPILLEVSAFRGVPRLHAHQDAAFLQTTLVLLDALFGDSRAHQCSDAAPGDRARRAPRHGSDPAPAPGAFQGLGAELGGRPVAEVPRAPFLGHDHVDILRVAAARAEGVVLPLGAAPVHEESRCYIVLASHWILLRAKLGSSVERLSATRIDRASERTDGPAREALF